MIVYLLAALLGGFQQVNPPGTLVMPSQAAFYSATGGTAVVEIRNYQGLPIPFVDAAGTKWPSATVTLPAGSAVGLGWLLGQTKPDGLNSLNPPGPNQSTLVVRMNCTATESPVGTYDGLAGTGSGIALGYTAPNSTTPMVLAAGVTYTIAPGGGMTINASSGTYNSLSTTTAAQPITPTSVLIATQGGNPLGPSRIGVIFSNTGSNDVFIGTSSGNAVWIVPAGSGGVYVMIGSSVTTLYAWTLTGTGSLSATEYGR